MALALALVLGLGLIGLAATAADDEPPPLEPPAGSVPVVAPTPEAEGPLPGRPRPSAPEPGPLPDLVPPPLTGPAEMKRAAPASVPAPVPTTTGSTRRPGPRPSRPLTAPTPPRRVRLFNRSAAPAPRPRPADATIAVVPRSDPAADAALKRRLEAQVRSTLGAPLRALEVRVVGRDVAIRARVDRFWRRRAARRAIEALPSLAGYRARVEVTD